MPTTLDYYVDTAATAGGDGTTTALTGAHAAWTSWQAARAGLASAHPNLVTDDVLIRLYLNASTGSADNRSDNNALSLTTDSTRFFEVFFEGQYQLVQSNSFWSILSVNTTKIIIHDINGLHTGARTNDAVGINFGIGQSSGWYELDGGKVLCTGTGTPSSGHQMAYVSGTSNPTVIQRNLLINGWGKGTVPNSGFGGGRTTIVDNCTVVNCTTGVTAVRASGDTYILRNNLCQNNITDYSIAGSGGTLTTATNLSEDTTSPDASLQSVTVTFKDSGSGDYRLATTDTVPISGGTDLSAASFAFSDDLTGATRTSPWSLGAYEFLGQTAYPVSDNSIGNWTTDAGGTTNLYAAIDDTTTNDSDYIKSGTSPVSDTVNLALGALGTPDTGTVTIHVRAGLL